MKDTTNIFLVNRRCFERTTDITDSVRGRLMTPWPNPHHRGQAEPPHPTIRLQLRAYQEIAADTSRLPLATGPRSGLDTIVNADSMFAITLGPGRAALLRITHAPPTESIALGDLRFGSQRKLLFDGRRYHSAFHRANASDPYGIFDTSSTAARSRRPRFRRAASAGAGGTSVSSMHPQEDLLLARQSFPLDDPAASTLHRFSVVWSANLLFVAGRTGRSSLEHPRRAAPCRLRLISNLSPPMEGGARAVGNIRYFAAGRRGYDRVFSESRSLVARFRALAPDLLWRTQR